MVWERKKASDDPDKPPTVDFIPFLSVSRSLGDFWSWCERTQQFVVSPHPDVCIHPLDPTHQKFLVLASDGLWNVMSPQDVVDFICDYETVTEDKGQEEEINQSRDVVRALIDEALYRWRKKGMFADNISVVIAFLSHEGSAPAIPSLVETSAGPSGPVGRVVEEEECVLSTRSEGVVETVEAEPNAEDRTVVSLHCCHKDKLKPVRGEEAQGREEERSPVKRPREEVEAGGTGMLVCPPPKKTRQERDSGCESDSGSPVTEEAAGSLVPESSSSGIFSETEPCNSSPLLLPSPPLSK